MGRTRFVWDLFTLGVVYLELLILPTSRVFLRACPAMFFAINKGHRVEEAECRVAFQTEML